jgi:hypothetical protein
MENGAEIPVIPTESLGKTGELGHNWCQKSAQYCTEIITKMTIKGSNYGRINSEESSQLEVRRPIYEVKFNVYLCI